MKKNQSKRPVTKENQSSDTVNERVNVFSFSTDFPKHPNALHIDQEGRLFLESTKFGPGALKEAELVEVLDWYVLGNQFSDGSDGNMDEVCELASAEIKRLRALCAERGASV